MLAVLDEYHRSCVLVIDKGSARVWEIYLDMREVSRFSDRVLRKPNYAAGLAEDRVRNKADELSKRHYRRVAEVLDERSLAAPWHTPGRHTPPCSRC